MENFEQAKVNAAMEDSRLSPATLLPLAHSDKRAAETRSLLVLLATTATVLFSWAMGLTAQLGTLATYTVCAILFYAAAYIIRGARRKREIAALSVSTLEELCRFAPEKIRRDLVQKVFADKLRRGAKARIGLKRGARPYSPQDKPGWKSVDYTRLLDLKATRKKNRGDRAAFLYTMAVFAGSCFVGRFVAHGIQTFGVIFIKPLGLWAKAHPLRLLILLAILLLVIAFCITWILTRRYWLSLTEIYAYGVDCEKDSFYAVWNEASHLYPLVSKADGDQRDGDAPGGGQRRRHRGGKGKKKPAAEAKPAESK